MLKKYNTHASPVAQKFQAMATPDTVVKRRVAAVGKLKKLRVQWESGEIRQAIFGAEATTNHQGAHLIKMRRDWSQPPPKQDEGPPMEPPPEGDGEDEEMPDNIEAPVLDIRNLSPVDCQFVVEHINHYNQFGFNKDDIESEKDRRFQDTLLKLIAPPPKNPMGRAKSAPRGPSSSKSASTSAKRAQSVRIPRQSGRSADTIPQEAAKPVETPPAAETDDGDSDGKWKQVVHGQKRRTEGATQRYKEIEKYKEYAKRSLE